MTDDFEPVAFISVEGGDDLIVSVFVARPDDLTEGRSLILMRDKKWEYLLADSERGVKVSDEDFSKEEEWDDNYLQWICLGNTTAEIKSSRYHHKLDLRRVDKSELREAKKILKKMNYDKRFKLKVV